MSAIYKKGEIVWAKIQGYSWWPGRITKIRLKLCIRKNRLGKLILKYEKEPYFYITFFPNDSICKVKQKYIKKFIEGIKIRKKIKERKKLKKAVDIATKTFLEENPDLNIDIKKNIFNIKLISKKKFPLLRHFRALGEEEEEMNGENDIQSFIDSEMDECENYKNELKDKNKTKYIGNKRKKSKIIEDSENTCSENEDSLEYKDNKNIKYNKELKKYSNELYKKSVEIKRKNIINDIINLFNNIEDIINKNEIKYDFEILKDLLIILNNYTNYNNESIMNKSISLHKNLIAKYLNNFFECDNTFIEKEKIYSESLFNNPDKNEVNNNIASIEEFGQELSLQIISMNNNKNECNILTDEKNKNKKSNLIINENYSSPKKGKENIINKNKIQNNLFSKFGIDKDLNDTTIDNNKDNNKNEISNCKKLRRNYENYEKEELESNDSFDDNEPFLKEIINNPNYFSKKPEGKLYPDNFFEEVYLKSGITSKTELLRKKMCLQLYNVLKLVLPFCQEDIFKKNVIFLEYLARHLDPFFGNKYMIIINMIYNRIKSEAVKIKNNKNKNKI